MELNFTVGETNSIKIVGQKTSYPGKIVFEEYDAKYLQIKNVGWSHPPFEAPVLTVVVLPLKEGKTMVKGYFQIDEFNPLFETVVFDITIFSKQKD